MKFSGTLDADLNTLNDVDYLVERSRRVRKTDPYEAKAWMITAKMMFPENLSIQYEAYVLEKEEDKPAEAAKYLKELFENILERQNDTKNKETLDKIESEIDHIVSALQAKSLLTTGTSNSTVDEAAADGVGISTSKILCDIFNQLPRKTQENMLVYFSEKTPNVLAYTSFYMLIFELFPYLMAEKGEEFLKHVLVENKKRSDPSISLETLKAVLVTEVFPKILKEPALKLESDLLQEILEITMEYCCGKLVDLLAKLTDGGLQSSSVSLTRTKVPWKTILTFVQDIGQRLGWTATTDLSKITPDFLWNQIRTSIGNKSKEDELFFSSMLMFLHSLMLYVEVSVDLVLVEAFISYSAQDVRQSHQKKRLKSSDDPLPFITKSPNCEAKIEEIFLKTYKYYELICSEPTLDSRLQQFQTFRHFFHWFRCDVAMYQGNFREGLQVITLLQTPKTSFDRCKHCLRMTSLHFNSGNHEMAADFAMEAIQSASELSDSKDPKIASRGEVLRYPSDVKTRHMHFISVTKQEVICYAVRILINIMKDSIMGSAKSANDLAIGHVAVLLQYSFPEELELFEHIISVVKAKEIFTYSLFTKYIIDIFFLEEFSELIRSKDTDVILDVAPVSVVNQRRVGTRGANKGEKEDLKALFRNQVQRCWENKDDLIMEFVRNEKDSLLSFISQPMVIH